MVIREVRYDEKDAYNALVSHPAQCWESLKEMYKTG